MRRLGISNDFTSAWVSPSAPPPQGWPQADPGLPGPFAPAPLQGHHRCYEPVRPCAPHRYSAARGVRRSRSSLSRPASRPPAQPSVSGRQVLLFHASACDELTPPIHRAPPGQHAGRRLVRDARRCWPRLCPGDHLTLRFRCRRWVVSMRQQWFTHVRLLVAHLTRSRAFSAVASHPGS